jgi:glucose-6-phosphate-specific signal transduction histidine kinase
MNYITFILGIVIAFILYFFLFSDLLFEPSIFSFFLFVFFLPTIVIATTYLWEEKYPYDFMILHYSSIAFSMIHSIYIVFFVSW